MGRVGNIRTVFVASRSSCPTNIICVELVGIWISAHGGTLLLLMQYQAGISVELG